MVNAAEVSRDSVVFWLVDCDYNVWHCIVNHKMTCILSPSRWVAQYRQTSIWTMYQWYFSLEIHFSFSFYKFYKQSFLILYYYSFVQSNYFSFISFSSNRSYIYYSFVKYNHFRCLCFMQWILNWKHLISLNLYCLPVWQAHTVPQTVTTTGQFSEHKSWICQHLAI